MRSFCPLRFRSSLLLWQPSAADYGIPADANAGRQFTVHGWISTARAAALPAVGAASKPWALLSCDEQSLHEPTRGFSHACHVCFSRW